MRIAYRVPKCRGNTMSRHYCFTYFGDESPQMCELARYLVYQRERCPDTGKEHWQGYVEFYKTMRIKGAQEALKIPKAHMEKRRGTRDEARTYCMKEDTRMWGPYEHGVWIEGQGSRSDIMACVNIIQNGGDMKEVAETHPAQFIRLYRGLTAFALVQAKPRTVKTRVRIYYGFLTGTGKSRMAAFDLPNAFWMTDEKGWWDGYTGQKEVIIDDFNPSTFSREFMLRLMDRNGMTVPIKGGTVAWACEELIITTNHNPEHWYRDSWPHISRRCEELWNFDQDEGPVLIVNRPT